VDARTLTTASTPASRLDHALDRYLRHYGVLEWSADEIASASVERALARQLAAVAFVESEVGREFENARRAGLLRDARLAVFFDHWRREEDEHGRVLRALIDTDPSRWTCASGGVRALVSPIGLHAVAHVPNASASLLAAAAAAEYVTKELYFELARRCRDTTVERLLAAIGAQERRHFVFFVTAARALSPQGTIEQRVHRAVLRRAWRPVGMDRLGRTEWLATF
jgi:hypothetical protein